MSEQPTRHEPDVERLLAAKTDRLWGLLKPGRIPQVEELNRAYGDLVAGLVELCGGSAGCLVFLERNEPDFEAIVARGYGEGFEWWNRVKFGEGLVSQAALTAKPIFAPRVKNLPDYKPLREQTEAQITLPLADRHEGVFAVLAVEYDAPFGDTERQRTPLVGELLAAALREFRSDLLVARMRETFRQLNDIAQEGDDGKRLRQIMSAAGSFVGGGEVAVLERLGGDLVVWDADHIDPARLPRDLKVEIATEKGYVCSVAHTRKPFYCKDTRDKKKYDLYLAVMPETRSQYTTPLIFDRELVGILNIGCRVPYGFTETDRKLIDLFADHAANALYDMRLVGELRKGMYRALERLQYFDFMADDLLASLHPGDTKRVAPLREAVTDAKGIVSQFTYQLRPIDVEPVAIRPLLRGTLRDLEREFRGHGVHCRLKRDEVGELVYPLMERQFTDILQNVLWAALRAAADSAPKEVGVSATVERQDVGGQEIRYLCVAVEDSGPPPDTERPEESLRPGSSWPTRPGVGPACRLELWVCDHILANYGGYLDRRPGSEGGSVTKLWLKIP